MDTDELNDLKEVAKHHLQAAAKLCRATDTPQARALMSIAASLIVLAERPVIRTHTHV